MFSSAIVWLSKNWKGALVLSIVVAAGLYVAGLHFAVWHYRADANEARRDLAKLQGKVDQQNETATRRLAELTQENARIQSALNAQAKAQETQDAQAQAEIARLDGELRNRPVRVRVQSCSHAGSGNRSAQGDPAANPQDRPGDTETASGILPPENTRRLAGVIQEIETLSAAYASCKSSLAMRY